MLAIAFEGCACRAAFHAGVVQAFAAAGVHFPLAAGTSSGALVACCVAAGRSAEVPSFFRVLGDRSVVSLRRMLWNRSIFDMSYIVRDSLRRVLGAGDLRDAPGEAVVAATRVRDFATVFYSSRDEPDFVEPVLGSCFVPPLYGRAIRVRGEWLLDGGFTDNLPLAPLVQRGARELIAVVTSPSKLARKAPRQLAWRPHAQGARIHVIAPREPLAIGYWDFRADRMEAAMLQGIHAVEDFLAHDPLLPSRTSAVDVKCAG